MTVGCDLVCVVLRGVELGRRQRCQVQQPEHGKETEGEAHPQGKTEDLQAGSDNAEVMEEWGKDGKTLYGVAFT